MHRSERRQVPQADICSAAKTVSLFDHFVGEQQEGFRYRQPERLGGLEIDAQREIGRLLDRQLTHLGASEDAVNVACRLAVLFSSVVSLTGH
jgi:hypothetical protein